MKILATELKDVYILEPAVFGDSRGWFMETYSKQKLADAGLNFDFVQDNQSFSKEKGILRGLHFQVEPKAQTKLVRCLKGRILDVAVDLRRGSPTYLQSIAIELSEENKKQLLIPKGFAHGFLTLCEDVEVAYKVDEFYSKECDRSIRFDEPLFNVQWPVMDYILSDKDINALGFEQCDVDFIYKEETQ